MPKRAGSNGCPITTARAAGRIIAPQPTRRIAPALPANLQLLPTQRNAELLSHLDRLRDQCRCSMHTLALLICDLDPATVDEPTRPVKLNHEALARFEHLLRDAAQEGMIVEREQGQRLIVAMPDSTAQQASVWTQRARTLLSSQTFSSGDAASGPTFTSGITESSRGCLESVMQLLRQARLALARGQREGGNRSVIWLASAEAGVALEGVNGELQGLAGTFTPEAGLLHYQLQRVLLESTQALVAAVEARDPYTRTHSLSVSLYADAIGRRMQLDRATLDAVRCAALLHDLGKIGIPDAILSKPGPLTREEFEQVKRHPQTALIILSHISMLRDERPMILHHHERYDGRGYPDRLSGERIPLGARVLAVADALDTMLSARTYKPAFSLQQSRAELVAGANTQFDPGVVDAALALLDDPDRLPSLSLRT